jgi:hypothetical protein
LFEQLIGNDPEVKAHMDMEEIIAPEQLPRDRILW